MKKVKVKIPAKINLTLDVIGANGGYHDLKSLVTTVNLFDTVTVKKRKDKNISVTEKGIKSGVTNAENNAYKTAREFIKTFNTFGVDIVIDKKIPVANGMGGSSADIAGVLIAMKKLFGVEGDLGALADRLGSDAKYMLTGGYAVLEGRGDKITYLNSTDKFYLLLLSEKEKVSSLECFSAFDKLNIESEGCTDKAIKSLQNKEYTEFLSLLKNDLFIPAVSVKSVIKDNLEDVKTVSKFAVMTGSGSAVFGIFLSKKERDFAYKKLKIKYNDRLYKLETI